MSLIVKDKIRLRNFVLDEKINPGKEKVNVEGVIESIKTSKKKNKNGSRIKYRIRLIWNSVAHVIKTRLSDVDWVKLDSGSGSCTYDELDVDTASKNKKD